MVGQSVAKQYYSFVGRTLAEENLHGFSFKKSRKRGDTSLNPYSPQRIELPLYFNTPKRKDDLVNVKRYKTKSDEVETKKSPYLNNQSALNMFCADSGEQLMFKKRLKDYNLLAFACKRANKTRVAFSIMGRTKDGRTTVRECSTTTWGATCTPSSATSSSLTSARKLATLTVTSLIKCKERLWPITALE
eukprot:TRINITY_DN5306_c0_g2_i2.p2 TRINITY_DN5306_c0_g2~~TRINITY_DN5306_c0_g2_i2.p2  ORF type:complete len:190 (+),score=29.17 TRINITY_DN5306_c0_g2_i2:227-796(+)